MNIYDSFSAIAITLDNFTVFQNIDTNKDNPIVIESAIATEKAIKTHCDHARKPGLYEGFFVCNLSINFLVDTSLKNQFVRQLQIWQANSCDNLRKSQEINFEKLLYAD